VLSITLVLFASSAVSADAAVGLGVSDGDHRLMWLETNDWSVSREIANQYDERWNTKEEDLSGLDYDTYMKSFRWYMVFERKF